MLQSALNELARHTNVEAVSAIYETAPMYVPDQPEFFNAVARVETQKSPTALLSILKSTEALLGRTDAVRYGPRAVDLDLIVYGRCRYRYWVGGEVKLELPHPKAVERRFVLLPLSEVVVKPELVGIGNVEQRMAETAGQASGVRRLAEVELKL